MTNYVSMYLWEGWLVGGVGIAGSASAKGVLDEIHGPFSELFLNANLIFQS